ncbi:MAG: Ca ion P-type ATPase, partial [Gammaproteobacteria bacterium]|nr:Ca ion P-type ATPase [Gammaproteobacteria bacterium]
SRPVRVVARGQSALQKRHYNLWQENNQLKNDNSKLDGENRAWATKRDEVKQEVIERLNSRSEAEAQVQSITTELNRQKRQYELVCGFIAMVAESPSVTDSADVIIGIFETLKKPGWQLLILPTNGGECLVIIWAIINGSLLPVLPLHILWINLITTVALAITLAFEPVEAGTMKVPPRGRNAPLIEPHLIWRIILVSVIMAAGTFGLFYLVRSHGQSLEAARTVAVNTIVFFEIFYIFNTRYLTASVLSIKGLLENKVILIGAAAVIILQMLFTYWPTFNRLFQTEPINLGNWLLVLAITVCIFFIVELEKMLLINTKYTRQEQE